MHTDGQTDKNDEANSRFSKPGKRAQKKVAFKKKKRLDSRDTSCILERIV
jgi:hypothetical protein